MRNKLLQQRTAVDIDRQVAKVLHGLGNPKPPLRLEEVLELLKLDRQYYSSTDDSALREVAHNLKVAGKQIIQRPTLLLDAIRAFDLKALFLPDRKRILIDKAQPELKWRWNEAHEITHSIIPWHEDLALGDDKFTLAPSCYEQLEAEANYGAGRLLFLQDLFDEMARETEPVMESIKDLSKVFGNTITNTLWRYVERSEKILFGIVSVHPRYLPPTFDPNDPCKYFIRSKAFAEKYPDVTEGDIFNGIRSYCSWAKRGPLGTGEVIFRDYEKNAHIFQCETFNNTHETLTLGVYGKNLPSSVILLR